MVFLSLDFSIALTSFYARMDFDTRLLFEHSRLMSAYFLLANPTHALARRRASHQ